MTEHFKMLTASLNQRLFTIRRISRAIPKNKLIGVVHSLWISKLRYGLQLCLKVRLTETDKKSTASKALQKTQNRMLRAISGTKIKDRVSIKAMLEKHNLLSVNQLAAKIKLIEVWKMINKEGSPLHLEPYLRRSGEDQHELRIRHNRIFNDYSKLKNSESSFHIDAARLWNALPNQIREERSLGIVKSRLNEFCKSLPI